MTSRSSNALAVLVVLALAIAAVPLAGAASEDERLMISQRMQSTGPGTQAGTWVAAGAVNDAGTAVATLASEPHGGGKGLVTATHILSSSSGTMTFESQTWARPTPAPSPPRVMVEGTWKLIASTGAYAELRALGKLYATADFTTGEITIVRDGSAG